MNEQDRKVFEEFRKVQVEQGKTQARIDETVKNTWRVTDQTREYIDEIRTNNVEQWKQIISNKTTVKWIIRVLYAAGILGAGGTGLAQWLGG